MVELPVIISGFWLLHLRRKIENSDLGKGGNSCETSGTTVVVGIASHGRNLINW